MKEIPDFDIELAQSIDYIFGSALAKKTFIDPPFRNYTNILTEILKSIDRLADNCHMPEFTNHAMPHICSIVKRASEWAESDGWLEDITSQEAGYLLMALLIHDIGMLSQDNRDIPDSEKARYMKGFSDVSNWVRRTHVIRIDGLVKFLLKDYIDQDETLSIHLNVVIGMAQSHARWPWESDFVSRKDEIKKVDLKEERIAAFNAVIAVCDLLDEDSNRCDTFTLIKHHHGTIENRAHWIRHALTKEVVGVRNHKVEIKFRRLIPESDNLDMVYRTLRNHYRLVKLYNEVLGAIHAKIEHIEFDPNDGIPEMKDEISEKLGIYKSIAEFKHNLTPQLLATFMKEARNQDDGDTVLRKRLNAIGLEVIDMSQMESFFNPGTLMYSEERVIFGEGILEEKLDYAYRLAEEAYANGQIGKLRHVCVEVLELIDKHEVSLEQVYWALGYLIIYEENDLDFSLAERTMQSDCKIKPSKGPYQGLLDVIFCFLKPSISNEKIREYKEHLFKYDYLKLKNDFITKLLIQTVIGLFWFWDAKSEVWCEVSAYMQQNIQEDSLVQILKDQQRRLKLQYRILNENEDVLEQELMEVDQPVLARGWCHFYRADWEKVSEDVPQMIRCAEYNSDLFCSVQGFQNMTRNTVKWSGIDRDNGEFEDVKGIYAGIYRYQRTAGEQALPIFWKSRENHIETALVMSQMKPTETAYERIKSLRLISLRQLDALQYWNLGEYLESVRNEARWFYDSSVYEDKYGTYCGYARDLPQAIVSSIQGMDNSQFTKEERQHLIIKMRRYFPEGIETVVQFIVSNTCKCMWEYTIQWLENLILELDSNQLNKILKWLVQYDSFVQTQKLHFNLGEYKFLGHVVDRFSETDWDIIMPIVERIYRNSYIYRCNEEFNIKGLIYMPIFYCKKMLTRVAGWQVEGDQKRNAVYRICISLSQKRGREINLQLHQLIDECRKLEPCDLYDELDKLVDIENLSERNELDIEGICQVLEESMEKLNMEQISVYDSRFLNDIKEKFTNQNWRLVPEEKVLAIVHQFLDFLLRKKEELSPFYFYDICLLLKSISRMGTRNEKAEIVTFYIKEYILTYTRQNFGKQDFIDSPLNMVHFDFCSIGLKEEGVFSVLINCITEIPQQYQYACINWGIQCLSEEGKSVLYYFAVLLFSYYYFVGEENVKNMAFCGLMYIRGHLEAGGKYLEIQLMNVLQALKELIHVNEWFGESEFMQLVNQDTGYKELFFDIVQSQKENSCDIEIRHWSLQ